MMTDTEQFVDLVSRMRHFQRRWFKYHNQADLTESKTLERQVDRELERLTVRPAPTLFDRGDYGLSYESQRAAAAAESGPGRGRRAN